MTEQFLVSENTLSDRNPAGLAGEYLRSFADATRRMADFEGFHEILRQLVIDDVYLAGAAEIEKDPQVSAQIPDFGNIDSSETVISLLNTSGNAGYLKYRGRRDGEPFSADDLHLMGAIAGFISVLTAQARHFRLKDEKTRIFQYLINQLPLGVICLDRDRELLVENNLATQLLGDSGSKVIRDAFSEKTIQKQKNLRLHLEVDGKLLYIEGQHLQVDADLSVYAFVLYDMSHQREKDLLQLERAIYRAESRSEPLTVAVFEDRSEAGRLYRALQASAVSLQLDPGAILAMDAYSCACIFTSSVPCSVRLLLNNGWPKSLGSKSTTGVLVSEWAGEGFDAAKPAESLMELARGRLLPLFEVFRPALLVLDPYPAVVEALDLAAGEVARFERVAGVAAAQELIQSGEWDGLFLDVDSYMAEAIQAFQKFRQLTGRDFHVFYLSHKQPAMVHTAYDLEVNATVFQKPFDAEKLKETLALQFNLA